MKTVITYGTFDLFHIGHLNLLERAKSLGDKLIVGCSTEEFNALKGKKTIINYEDRARILSACRYVDLVIPENCWEQKRQDILKHNIDIFVMGDDWSGKFNELSDICTVTYLPRTEKISTTDVKEIIKQSQKEKISAILRSLEKISKEISLL